MQLPHCEPSADNSSRPTSLWYGMLARPGCGNKTGASRVTLDKYMPRWFNLANLFTLLRLILVPYVIGAILAGRHGLALELFFVAALTDVIDGTLARSYGLATEAGAYLDPIADKCLLSGIFLALGATGKRSLVVRGRSLRARYLHPPGGGGGDGIN